MGLFALMVPTAERREIALTSAPACFIGHRVIEVAAARGPSTPGERATLLAYPGTEKVETMKFELRIEHDRSW